MRTSILAFTQIGESLADRLLQTKILGLEPVRHDPSLSSARAFVADQFRASDLLVFIGAAAIAVRLIAPLLRDKSQDPAVLVLDETGRYVIPILSGHLGGANQLALQVAKALNATPVITTATDLHNRFAVDVWSRQNNCAIRDITRIKAVSSRILAHEPVGLLSDFPIEGELPEGLVAVPPLADDAARGPNPAAGIWVSQTIGQEPFALTLQVIPKTITIGVGCRKGTDPAAFEDFILAILASRMIALEAVAGMASIDLKKDEPCILAFCDKYKLSLITYSSDDLQAAKGEFQTSTFVRSVTGVDNVCERSAILASSGQMILSKQIQNGMTCALASQEWRCIF